MLHSLSTFRLVILGSDFITPFKHTNLFNVLKWSDKVTFITQRVSERVFSSVFFVSQVLPPILSTCYLRLSTFVGHGYWEVRPSVVFARRDFSLSYSLVKVRSQLPKVVSSGHCQASPFSGYPVRGCRFTVRADVRLRSVFTVGCESLYTFTALPSVLSLISSTVYSIAHFLTLCKGFL